MAKADKNVDTETGEIKAVDLSKAPIKKLLNLPVLSQKNKATIYVAFLSPIFTGRQIIEKVVDGKQAAKQAAKLAYVCDLINASPAQIILSAIQESTLCESYPNAGYVGKCFRLENLGKAEGKDYNMVRIAEMDVDLGIDFEAMTKTLPIPDSTFYGETTPQVHHTAHGLTDTAEGIEPTPI